MRVCHQHLEVACRAIPSSLSRGPGAWEMQGLKRQKGEAEEWVFSPPPTNKALFHRLNPMEPILSVLSFTSHYLISPLHIAPSLLLKCFSCLPFLFQFHSHHSTSSPCQLMPNLIQHHPRRCPCLQGLPTPTHSAQLPGKSSLGNVFVISSPISEAFGVSGSLLPPTSWISLFLTSHSAFHCTQAYWLLNPCICFSFINLYISGPWSKMFFSFLSANPWPWLLFQV